MDLLIETASALTVLHCIACPDADNFESTFSFR